MNQDSCTICVLHPHCVECFSNHDHKNKASALKAVHHSLITSNDYKIVHCLRFLDRLAEIENEKGW